MKNKLTSILTKSSIKVATILGFSFLLVTVVSAQTWNPAPASPPNNNAPTPINISNTAQFKSGSFSSVGGVATGRNSLPTAQELLLGGITFPLTSLKLFVQGQSVLNSDNFTQLYLRGSRSDRAGGLSITNSSNEYLRLEMAGQESNLIGLQRGDALISANKNIQLRGNSDNGTVREAQLFIQGSNGNVGIGTGNITPTSRLVVAGSGAFSGGLFVNGSPVVLKSVNPGVNKILASTDTLGTTAWKTPAELGLDGGVSNWTLDGNNIFNNNTGNVGVGTTNPDRLLTLGYRSGQYQLGLKNSVDVTRGTLRIDNNGHFELYNSEGNKNIVLQTNTDAPGHILLNPQGGNVGVGTANPNYKLHVVGSSSNGQVFRSQFTNTNLAGATNIELFNGGSHAASIGVNGPNRNVPNASFNNWGWLHNGGGGWAFFAGQGDGLSNLKMVIAPTGNVGIGNINPSSLLSLRGNNEKVAELKIEGTNDIVNNNIGLNVDSARNAHVILDRGNIGQTSYVRHTTGGVTDWYAGINARQNSDYQISNTFNDIVGQLTIKKDTGNVGLGTNNPISKLDVNTGGISGGIRIKTNSTNNTVASNISFTNTTSDEVHSQITSGRNGGTNGNLSFSTRQAGVLREVLRLTEGGNVGIGISNPGAKLEVNGSSIIGNGLAVLGGNTLLGSRPAGAELPPIPPSTTKLEVNGSVRLNTFNVTGGTPGLNKILASVDNIGTVAWKTPAELGLTAGGGGGDSEWELIGSGPNINNARFGSVGIGTNIIDGSDKVNVKGALRITSNQNNEYLRISRETGFGQIQTYNSEPLFVNPAGNNTILNQGNGNVGVGTIDPSEKLEVSGGFRVTNPSTGEYLRISRETGFGQIQSYNNEPLFVNPIGNNTILNQGNGNVGVGTNNPTAKLDIVGDTRITGALVVSSFINANWLRGNNLTVSGGDPAPGKVLTATDSEGNATWQDGGGSSISSSNFRTLKRGPVETPEIEVFCGANSIAIGGGVEFIGRQGGTVSGIAAGTGEINDGIAAGIGSVTGVIHTNAVISRPGTKANYNNSSYWYCARDSGVLAGGNLTCYARCLDL